MELIFYYAIKVYYYNIGEKAEMFSTIKNYFRYSQDKNMEWGLGFVSGFVFTFDFIYKEYLFLLLLWYWAYSGNRWIILLSLLSYALFFYEKINEDLISWPMMTIGFIFFLRDMYFMYKYRVNVLGKDMYEKLALFGALSIWVGALYYFKS